MAAKEDNTLSRALTNADAVCIEVYKHTAQLPATVCTQWEYGDWPALKSITLEDAEQHEAKSLLAAIIAVAHHQDGTGGQAQPYLEKVLEWGMDKRAIAMIFAAGVYNSLGRTALMAGDTNSALKHFQQSIESSVPGADSKLLTPIRAHHQSTQMGIQIAIPYLTKLEDPSQLEENAIKTYTEQLMVIMGSFAERLVRSGQDLVVDGVEVFREKDPFLAGKVAMGLAYWVTEHPSGSAITKQRCQKFRQVMQNIDDQDIESWGIHFYLKALQMLNDAGLLTKCFSFRELAELRKRLDWRSFVNETDYTLNNMANNFYGVAYSISYSRYQLGWDSLKHSQCLLEKELDHYEEVSGGQGFADETNGKGRFDRYSFLLIAEIAYCFHEAGLPLTRRIKKWLKASADYVLFNVNDNGDGFQWGRSIGAYGDSAFLEILTAAAIHNLLDEEEQAVASYFANRITKKFLTFWYQKNRQSINIWTDGRATDGYRGIHRILGENLTLIHQHLYCQRVWEKYPLYENDIILDETKTNWNEYQFKIKKTEFKIDGCSYSVINYNGKDMRLTLPLVNGERYHNQMAYQPIPFLKSWIDSIPDYRRPIARPIMESVTGIEYITFPCYENVELDTKNGKASVNFEIRSLTRINSQYPEKLFGGRYITKYGFWKGVVSGFDDIEFDKNAKISSISYSFPFGKEILEFNEKKVIYVGLDGRLKEFELCVDENLDIEPPKIEKIISTVESGSLLLCHFKINIEGKRKMCVAWEMKDLESCEESA